MEFSASWATRRLTALPGATGPLDSSACGAPRSASTAQATPPARELADTSLRAGHRMLQLTADERRLEEKERSMGLALALLAVSEVRHGSKAGWRDWGTCGRRRHVRLRRESRNRRAQQGAQRGAG